MQTDDKYNGWTNRETWAVYLYLTNDYNTSRYWADEIATNARCNPQPKARIYWLADRLKDEHETARDDIIDGQSSRETRACFADIGLLWRVNWDEVAKALIGDDQ